MATERRSQGFTLVELLVVVAIMAAVAGLVALKQNTGGSAAETAFLDTTLSAVQTLPGLARSRNVTLGLVPQGQQLVTVQYTGTTPAQGGSGNQGGGGGSGGNDGSGDTGGTSGGGTITPDPGSDGGPYLPSPIRKPSPPGRFNAVPQTHLIFADVTYAVYPDGPSIPIPQDATVSSSLTFTSTGSSGTLTVHVGNTCQSLTPLTYGGLAWSGC